LNITNFRKKKGAHEANNLKRKGEEKEGHEGGKRPKGTGR